MSVIFVGANAPREMTLMLAILNLAMLNNGGEKTSTLYKKPSLSIPMSKDEEGLRQVKPSGFAFPSLDIGIGSGFTNKVAVEKSVPRSKAPANSTQTILHLHGFVSSYIPKPWELYEWRSF